MAFFENLGKKVGDAAQSAAKKSNEFMEVNKLNSNINSEEDKIKELFLQIGESVYKKYCSNNEKDENYIDIFEQIKAHEDNIINLRMRVSEIKKVKVCPQCKNEVDLSITFCPKCGAKQEMEKKSDELDIKSSLLCPSCGAELQPGTAFCGSCGQKLS